MTEGPTIAPDEEADAASGVPSMADRLAGVCVDLRPDLEVSRHVFRGAAHYILRDPVSFESHRFNLEDYRILTHMQGDRTLGESFVEMVDRGILCEEDAEHFYSFILSLHKISFLMLPISDDKSLYQRHEARRKAKRAGAAKSALFFRIPLFAPDSFLNRTVAYARPLFSRPALVLWSLVIALACFVAQNNWQEVTEPVGDIFRNENLPLLWITLIGLKVVHEFGHAYATKALGGRVPEMGLMFMIFTPCAYVDASAAWGFPRKRDRIMVCMAGMYVELFLAAIALLAWSVMDPGFWRSVMHNAVMLASVITIGFNLNPLMRYDGYYALSDFLEIPNLRSRAQREGLDLLKRVLLGVSRPPSNDSLGLRAGLLVFGFAGAIYKVVLVLGISATIAIKFPVIGMLMGASYLLSETLGIIKSSVPYLWRSEETKNVRAWAMALSFVLLGGVPVAVMAIPLPNTVTTAAVLSGQNEVLLRADAPGFVSALPGVIGRTVAADETVVQLTDPGAQAQLDEVRAQLQSALADLAHSIATDPAAARKDQLFVDQLKQEVLVREAGVARLSVKSPLLGTLTGRLDLTEVGRHVERGEPLATIIGGDWVVRALLSEEEFTATESEPGRRVEYRSAAEPGKVWTGHIRRISPQGRREFDQDFARFLDPADYAVNPMTGKMTRSQFEIEVVLETGELSPPKLQGLRGKLRITGNPEPLGAELLKKVQTFLRRLGS